MGFNVTGGGATINNDGEANVNNTDHILSVSADGLQSDAVLIAGVANKHIEIHSVFVSTSAVTGVLELNEETSDDLKFKVYFKAGSSTASGILHTDLAVNKDLKITQPANVFTIVSYHLEDV